MMIRNTSMQNLFRQQPFARVSVDFIVQTYYYIEALEPGLKTAVSNGSNDKTVEICIRAFRMLAIAMQVFKVLSVNEKKMLFTTMHI
jgi:hypothetical protein